MKSSFFSKVATVASFVALTSAMLLAPLQASASGTKSLGHGVKCGWMLVSYDAATGSSVYTYVCGSGGA